MSPFELLHDWLAVEALLGAPNPKQAVLATATPSGTPHARVVAIREIDSQGFLFFTQTGTRKVAELTANPQAVLTFWFELKQREIIVEGVVTALSAAENERYWHAYPREAQLRFHAYAPTSSEEILSKAHLEARKAALTQEYANQSVPFSPNYCGFRLLPKRFIAYAYRLDELSDVCSYELNGTTWQRKIMSP